MRIYDSAFYAILFFLFGVFVSSFGLKFFANVLIVLLTTIALLLLGYYRKNSRFFWFSGLVLFAIVGSFYFFIYGAYQYQTARIIFDKEVYFKGIVVENRPQNNSQKLSVDLIPPFKGKVEIQTRPFPNFNYGDLVEFNETIKAIAQESAFSYLKDGILGVSSFPKTKVVSVGNGNFIKAELLGFKKNIISIFQKILPEKQAAFLSGITLGERAEFSKEFRDQMSQSGTTHLVALSGYNISILVAVFAGTLGYFFSRKICFWLTLIAILMFVLMTGAEASVVRAAIMGGIILSATQINRAYSFRNIIAVAALLMVLVNPFILVFDVGFQLSFMALLGIVYFSPAIKKVFKMEDDPGFLSWKENLLATVSAQVFVAPFLISYFGNFSLLSLLANILILAAIPLTMSLGFMVAAIGFVSLNTALVFGWLVNVILVYEISIIEIFGNLDFFQIKSLSVPLMMIYYALLVGFVLFADRVNFASVNYSKIKDKIFMILRRK